MSARSKELLLDILSLLGLIVLPLIVLVVYATSGANYATLHTAAGEYRLEIVDDDVERSKGLGGRDSLAERSGMLFVFPDSAERCFWMKDMRFSLDILWLNADKQVVRLEQDIAPETYPERYCANDTRYVIELDQGEAARAGLTLGQTLKF